MCSYSEQPSPQAHTHACTHTHEYLHIPTHTTRGVTGQLQGKERWCIGEDLVDADMAAIVGLSTYVQARCLPS